MSDYKIHYTIEAIQDLMAIYHYIAIVQSEKNNVEKLIREIRNRIQLLDQLPNRNPLLKKQSLAEKNIHYFPVKNHLILYQIEEIGKQIYILRIVSNKRNIEKLI